MNVTYRSQKHTTLANIARQFGIAVTDILAANPNKQYSIIRGIGPGEEIYVPFYETRTGFVFGTCPSPITKIGETSTEPAKSFSMTKDEFESFFTNFGTFLVCLLVYKHKY